MTKTTASDAAYVYKADLARLIGPLPAVTLLAAPATTAPDLLVAALREVLARLCPYPALRIADWFWQTPAGQMVARAQWTLYGAEAMRPAQVCRALWGGTGAYGLDRLNRLIQRGELIAYPLPSTARIGARHSQVYMRRSDVQRLLDTGRFTPGPVVEPRPSYVDPDPPPPGMRRCSKRERCLHPAGPILPLTAEYFLPNKRTGAKLGTTCRVCAGARVKAYNRAHPAAARASKRRYYEKKMAPRRKRKALPEGMKRCSKRGACLHPDGPVLPATTDYFGRHTKEASGLYCQCKVCRRAEVKRQKKKDNHA